jgi:hypothetical protein
MENVATTIFLLQMRYYIMSRKLSAEKFAETVRGHWSGPAHTLGKLSCSKNYYIFC